MMTAQRNPERVIAVMFRLRRSEPGVGRTLRSAILADGLMIETPGDARPMDYTNKGLRYIIQYAQDPR
jgi:hypothetical protein